MFAGPALHDVPGMPQVGDIPRAGAERFGSRIALVSPELGSSWTYRQLDHRVGRALGLLRELGLQKGDRFVYLGRNSDNFVLLQFAAIRGGMVMVALNWRSAPTEVEYFLADSKPSLVFVDPEFRATIEKGWAEGRAASIISTESANGHTGLRALLDQDGPVITESVDDVTLTCLILYTSGTTGQPKGAMISHEMLTLSRQVEYCAAGFPPTGEDRVLVAVPAFHLGGITMIQIALVRGAECILTNDPSSANLLHLCQQYKVTLTWLVPTMILALVDLIRREQVTLPDFRTMMYGGAPISPELLLDTYDVLKCRFSNSYGATEVGSVTILPPDDHSPDKPELLKSVGRSMPGAEMEIRDPEGRSLAPHNPGEVWVRTPTLMSGYWNRPKESAEAVVDGWYRTGDGGYQDEQGYLYLTDRIKDMIVSGGENIYPVQVENALRLHPAVQEVAVVGVPDPRWGETALAVIELRPGSEADAEGLIHFIREHLAPYKCPKAVKFVSALPKTASGKVQRGQVRKDLAAGLI